VYAWAVWFEGEVIKDKNSRYWAVGVSALDVFSQGTTKKKALEMLKSAIEDLADDAGLPFKITVSEKKGKVFVTADDNRRFLAFFLKRQRQSAGLSLSQVAKNLGAKSKNGYARYEQAKAEPGVSKLEELIRAINPSARTILNVG